MKTVRSPIDAPVRREVIEPDGSYLVQAPAGSGKTELLTQRFLRLLSIVERPQQVLAITFTRKATREMADRILERLRDAANGTVPEEPHKQLAHELAGRVLARDRDQGWKLLANPALLQIHTIDGLCARLAARGGGDPLALAGLAVAEHPRPLYEEAARRTIARAARAPAGRPERDALEDLLFRERGSANRLRDLLADELPRRDQWFGATETAEARRQDLLQLRQRLELEVLEACLGSDSLARAGRALRRLADLADSLPANDPFPAAWDALADAPSSAAPGARVLAWWALLAALATKAGNMPYAAKSLASNVYPGDAPERSEPLAVLGEIVAAWRDDPDALSAYARFRRAPPLDPRNEDRRLLATLSALLADACDTLKGLFAERGVCDFQHVAGLALQALGDEGAPGDALLIEDGRLEHVLIDEFQDTSQLQYDLVARLVAGWTPGDGRTLFLVGDPMQSIYAFRKADVDLFLDLAERGQLGDVPLAIRQLEVNFRSTPAVIDDVNRTGAAIFSAPSLTAPGHVDYTEVAAFGGDGGAVELRAFLEAPGGEGQAAEARWIAQRIHDLLEAGEANSVGVLARKRKQLEPVARALEEAAVDFEAVEVQALEHRPVVQDLLTLTRALLHPGDRVAWLGVLLAPWCGLEPADLLHYAGDVNDAALLARLESMLAETPTGDPVADRVRRVVDALARAHARAAVTPLAERVEATWAALGGPRVAQRPGDLDDADRFLRLLALLEREGPDDLLDQLQQRLQGLFATSGAARVQLMTIHKAKGLEFDAVFLPTLEGVGAGPARTLFRLREFRLPSGLHGSLMAPLRPGAEVVPSLYDHLGLLEREARASETQRLLYVAMTRARRWLYLTATCGLTQGGELKRYRDSFLDLLRPRFVTAIAEAAETAQPETAGTSDEDPAPRSLARLPVADCAIAPSSPDALAAQEPPSLGPPPAEPAHYALGEALHRWLELVHDHWDERWLGAWLDSHGEALRASLRIAGAPEEALDTLTQDLVRLLRDFLGDAELRDMLSPVGKQRSRAEAVYLQRDGNRLKRSIIDRLYQDADGVWHVIDYKTGAETEETRRAWAKQLERYAAAVERAEGTSVIEARVLQAVTLRYIDPSEDDAD